MTPNRSEWRFFLINSVLPALLVLVVAFVVAYQFVDPAPPRHITLAAGSSQGAYYRFAQRYRALLARDGVELRVLETAGSGENIKLLESGKAELAFIQGGVGTADEQNLYALAGVYYEPLWVFHRLSVLHTLGGLRGKRVSMGPVDSGTRALFQQLLGVNKLSPDAIRELPMGGSAALDALRDGKVDAVAVVAGVDSPLVERFMALPGVQVMDFARAAAYNRVFPFLAPVTLPQGVLDLAGDRPSRTLHLVAPTATLVSTEALHPALVDLLLQAATRVHRNGDLISGAGHFPSRNDLSFPLHPDAQRFFDHGPPLLQRYLPFWAATLVDRLKVMLIPLIAVLLPLIKIMPPVYRWRVRSRIYRWYAALENVHKGRDAPQASRDELLRELERLEDELSSLSVPLSYADELYELRVHLNLVRDKVSSMEPQP